MDSLSNRKLFGILLSGAALVAAAVYFSKAKTLEFAKPPEQLGAINSDLEVASVEEIDAWIKSVNKEQSAGLAIVNVWATWCEPCRMEMPELVKFKKAHPDIPVFLVSADNESDFESVKRFLVAAGVDFPSRLIKAPQDAFIEAWRSRSAPSPDRRWAMNLPVTFFIIQDGGVIQFLAKETNSAELATIAAKIKNRMKIPQPGLRSEAESL